VCQRLALEQDAAKELPANRNVWHYDMVDFLGWLNRVTWGSEWQKYDLPASVLSNAPPRPKTRK
jgi:hypothetical protein